MGRYLTSIENNKEPVDTPNKMHFKTQSQLNQFVYPNLDNVLETGNSQLDVKEIKSPRSSINISLNKASTFKNRLKIHLQLE